MLVDKRDVSMPARRGGSRAHAPVWVTWAERTKVILSIGASVGGISQSQVGSNIKWEQRDALDFRLREPTCK